MKKLLSVMLAAVVMLSSGAGLTTVKAAEVQKPTQTLYKITAVKDYKETAGIYIAFKGTEDTLAFDPLEAQNYVSLSDSTKFSAYGVTAEPVVSKDLKKIKGTLQRGTYLVNYELKPGLYKLMGKNGLAIRLSGVSIDQNADTKGFVNVDGTAYIKVVKGDYALKLIGDVTAVWVK